MSIIRAVLKFFLFIILCVLGLISLVFIAVALYFAWRIFTGNGADGDISTVLGGLIAAFIFGFVPFVVLFVQIEDKLKSIKDNSSNRYRRMLKENRKKSVL